MTRWAGRASASFLTVLGFCVLARAGYGQADPPWTLDACVSEALKASRRIRAQSHRVQGAEAAAREARAVRWPSLGLSGTYAYTSAVMSLDLPTIPGVELPQVEFGDGHVYDFHLSARVPVFTGGALAGRARAEEAALGAARGNLKTDRLSVLYEVRTAYFTALGAEAEAEAARLAEERLQRHIEELAGAIRAGARSEEDRLQALAHLRTVEQGRVALEARARVGRLDLGGRVGRPGTELVPEGELDRSLVGSIPPGDEDLDARPDLEALGERIRQARALASAARAAYLPQITAEVRYHHSRPGVDLIANEWMQYASAGVVLTWPIWEWGARTQRVRQAEATARSFQETREQVHEALRTRLEVARVHLDSARRQMEKAAERVALERRRLELVEGRYRNAAASESERLDAEDDLAAAEMDLASAAARVRIAEAEVLYVLGR